MEMNVFVGLDRCVRGEVVDGLVRSEREVLLVQFGITCGSSEDQEILCRMECLFEITEDLSRAVRERLESTSLSLRQ